MGVSIRKNFGSSAIPRPFSCCSSCECCSPLEVKIDILVGTAINDNDMSSSKDAELYPRERKDKNKM